MKVSGWILPVAIAVGLLVAGCAQDEQGSSDGTETTPGEGRSAATAQKTTSPEPNASEQGDTLEKGQQGRPGQGRARARGQVSLRLDGSEGTRFSGSCDVAGQRREISGTVPETYTFDLGDGALECEIRKQGPGNLKIVFSSDGSRSVQQVSGENVIVELRYEDGSLSTSTRSVS